MIVGGDTYLDNKASPATVSPSKALQNASVELVLCIRSLAGTALAGLATTHVPSQFVSRLPFAALKRML